MSRDGSLLYPSILLSCGLHVGFMMLGEWSFIRPHEVVIEINLMQTVQGRALKSLSTSVLVPKTVATEAASSHALASSDRAEALSSDRGNDMREDEAAGAPTLAPSLLPQMVNLSELGSMLRRYYPEKERLQRKEGRVVLDLHIDRDGHVSSVDIVQSAGNGFDQAARRVAKLLRFTPATAGSERVTVTLRQTIEFKLE